MDSGYGSYKSQSTFQRDKPHLAYFSRRWRSHSHYAPSIACEIAHFVHHALLFHKVLYLLATIAKLHAVCCRTSPPASARVRAFCSSGVDHVSSESWSECAWSRDNTIQCSNRAPLFCQGAGRRRQKSALLAPLRLNMRPGSTLVACDKVLKPHLEL